MNSKTPSSILVLTLGALFTLLPADWAGAGERLASPSAEAEAVSDVADPVRPFLFTVTTIPSTRGRIVVHYDGGYAERSGNDPIGYEGVEQRFGVQASLGRGVTVLGQFGLGLGGVEGSLRSSQQAEVLKDLLGGTSHTRLAVGVGGRREWNGTAAMLARISVGRVFDHSALFGNAVLERPFAGGRDPLDLVVSLGWTRRLNRAVSLGIEAIGEDLEGFWDPNEAEGGARLFAGPSVHVAVPGSALHVTFAVGPVIHASTSDRASTAPRTLSGSGGFAARVSIGYAF